MTGLQTPSTGVSPAMVSLASVLVAIVATKFALELAHFLQQPGLWDWAPSIATFVGMGPATPMTIEAMLITGRPLAELRGTLMLFIVIVSACQLAAIAMEDTLVPRPDGVAPFEDRCPDWLLRGLEAQ